MLVNEKSQVRLPESAVRALVRLLGSAEVVPDAEEPAATVITIEHRPVGGTPAAARPTVETPYLTLDEAAAYCRCSPRTIQNHHAMGNVRAMPATRPLRFRREDLDQWLSAGRRRRKR